MGETYGLDDLLKKTGEELFRIRADKQEELILIRKQKETLCANIIALQGLIAEESEGGL